MLAPCTVATWLPTLKQWLIRTLADVPLWKSQMSIHTVAMSDLGDALITLGLEAKEMSLKKCIFFKIVSTMLKLIGVLVPSFK